MPDQGCGDAHRHRAPRECSQGASTTQSRASISARIRRQAVEQRASMTFKRLLGLSTLFAVLVLAAPAAAQDAGGGAVATPAAPTAEPSLAAPEPARRGRARAPGRARPGPDADDARRRGAAARAAARRRADAHRGERRHRERALGRDGRRDRRRDGRRAPPDGLPALRPDLDRPGPPAGRAPRSGRLARGRRLEIAGAVRRRGASRRLPVPAGTAANSVVPSIGPGMSSSAGGISIPRTFIRRLSVR